ncbi:hypothetical protein EJ04DRAFT_566289 [Polyplosphaeria fusca]|uniref:Uncharacterized protein n=1 Tax=Polyplosphaeria fusca TaxID=682080 RepID=A0A9P4QQW9_9PLEO|nr:hypothetical protein EJ04DRAFT_566289 [Polyplosphaeria fusca]
MRLHALLFPWLGSRTPKANPLVHETHITTLIFPHETAIPSSISPSQNLGISATLPLPTANVSAAVLEEKAKLQDYWSTWSIVDDESSACYELVHDSVQLADNHIDDLIKPNTQLG